ncbi:hypothetical protein [Streptomyces sp. NBC_00448]|uniref:hypothetical protein n=1 Tax=Streptomyces sp. NBC_00448 TaxID=2903652 RepID=UPI002E1E6210
MAGDVWASALPLVGVALGGGLAAYVERAAQRSAERVEERRQASVTAESRRAEQLQVLKDFIMSAQAAESAAYSRPEPWGDDESGWMTRSKAVMVSLWTASGNVMLLCDESLQEPVRAYGHALNQAVWREIGDVEVNEHLETRKAAFMTAAREALAS